MQLDDEETGWVVLTVSGGSAAGPADWPRGIAGGVARVHETREVRRVGVQIGCGGTCMNLEGGLAYLGLDRIVPLCPEGYRMYHVLCT